MEAFESICPRGFRHDWSGFTEKFLDRAPFITTLGCCRQEDIRDLDFDTCPYDKPPDNFRPPPATSSFLTETHRAVSLVGGTIKEFEHETAQVNDCSKRGFKFAMLPIAGEEVTLKDGESLEEYVDRCGLEPSGRSG